MRAQLRSAAALALAVCAVAGPIAPAGAQTSPYGIGDPNIDVQCAASGPCPAAGWLTPLVHGATAMTYVRTGFPYDTAATADASGHCILAATGQYANPNHDRNGQPLWQSLQSWLTTAYALGLQPVVALTPATAATDTGYAAPRSDASSSRRYACGVYYMLQQAAAWGTPIHYLEAWNEPNLTGYSADPAGAARLYNIASEQAAVFAAGAPSEAPVDVAAGTMSAMTSPRCDGRARCPDTSSWLDTYIHNLASEPGFWSLHDYVDITAAGDNSTADYTANLDAFTAVLAAHYGRAYNAPIWVTEAGAQLQGGNGREPDGRAPGCDNGEPQDNLLSNGEWRISTCLNLDNPTGKRRQAWSAKAWLELPKLRPRVTQIDWWEPDDAAYSGWDSSLLDPDFRPRSSYCVIAYGEGPQAAAGDPRCPGNPLDLGAARNMIDVIG